jgi:hypothetical protein
MKKTQIEIINLANTIKNEAQNLPDESESGECNAESIEWSLEVARQLYAAAGGHIDEVEDAEVKRWLDGESSDLSDYEQ